MSIINKMLNDLDKKEPQEEAKQEVAFLEPKVAPAKSPRSKKWWAALISSGVSGILAVVVGYWYYNQNMQTLDSLDKMKPSVQVPADQNPAKANGDNSNQSNNANQVAANDNKQKPAQKDVSSPTKEQTTDAPANQPKLVVLNNKDENGKPIERKSTLSVEQKVSEPKVSQVTQPSGQVVEKQEQPKEVAANSLEPMENSLEPMENSLEPMENSPEPELGGSSPERESDDKAGQMSISKVSLSNAERAQKHVLQGQKLAQQGMIQPAIEKYQQAIKVYPSHEEARLALAGLFYGRNMVAEALEVLSEGLNIEPGNSQWSLLAAKIHYSRDNFAAALAYLQLPLHPVDNLEYIALKATTLQKLKDYQAAIDIFEQLTEAYPESARWWLGLATSLEGAEKYSQAVDAYRQTLRLGRISQTSRRFVLSRLAQLER